MPSLVRTATALLRAPANSVAFLLRSRLRWSRGPARLPNEAKQDLFAHLPADRQRCAEQRRRELCCRYDLVPLERQSSRLCYAENLMVLELLERLLAGAALQAADPAALLATDVGSGAFQYATGLHQGLRWHSGARQVVLRGVEIDGHGVYRDGHARVDHARAHAALAGNTVHYHVADFTVLRLPPQDVVTLLFPFVSLDPLLRWGLPLGLFRPRRLLRRAVAALRPGGLLLVVNQTAAEAARLPGLLRGQPVVVEHTARLDSELVPYAARTADRVGTRLRRVDADG